MDILRTANNACSVLNTGIVKGLNVDKITMMIANNYKD